MKLCLTIGVSEAPPLSHLPGAITAAHEIGDWAQQAGFITEVVTDEDKTPVTIARIRKTLLGMLPDNDEVSLFILHFAGHGFRSGAEQNIWLPSDWFNEMRAVSVEALKRQLYRHGIKSLTIFGDACRSLPTDIETADIFGDPVLPRGPYEAVTPIIDRFSAVVDGQKAYMLKGDRTAPPRCVFSTVLVEGLCGLRDEAFDKYLTDCVIPESLALFSKERLKEIGETYDLKCSPDYATGIPREHAVYYQRGGHPNGLPPLKWPAPPSRDQAESNENEERQDRLPEIKSRFFRKHIREGLSLRDDSTLSRFNLAIRGSVPIKIWSTSEIEMCSIDDNGGTYLVKVPSAEAIQILVEFADGVFASAVVYAWLTTLISRDENGEINWTCFSRWSPLERVMGSSVREIENLQAGNLTAGQVDDIAAELRGEKHVNPTLGAIASYLYDYTGDIDSIRRMAFFYCYWGQPMPFDVAFTGLLLSEVTGQADLKVHVPRVQARPRSLANDKLPEWVTKETHEESGLVAGLWPWLRQGWEFIEDPVPQEKAVAEGLRGITKFLLPSQFTSFKEEGARILIRKFHMRASK
ncbi:caspase family protein [Pseudomonas sp. NFACC13-1]|uniref:caspase family protein n=1 Tax=Pseudomonas sp. NFACC13-1 TaxID=1566245 RepID=UPI00088CFA3C|nr:caspase family protein [Pseudomonas sp. NFACC13-1]SDB51083.1 Caspase domain-containing protein [Pseudomonas sp. NFACC13-1]